MSCLPKTPTGQDRFQSRTLHGSLRCMHACPDRERRRPSGVPEDISENEGEADGEESAGLRQRDSETARWRKRGRERERER